MRASGDELRRPLLCAAALHLAVVGWFARRPPPAPPRMPAPIEAVEGTVELDTTTTAPPTEPALATAEAPANRAMTPAGRVAEPRAGAGAVGASAALTAGPPTDAAAPERATDWVVNPLARVDLSVPRSAFAPGGALEAPAAPGRRADPSAPAPATTSGGLVEGLDAHDVEIGLGRSGPVTAAVDAAAHDPAAPVLGIAVFAVSILDGGKVRVDVLDAKSERAGWEKLAPIIAKNLAQKAVRVPTTSKGLRVTVRVEASE